MSIDIGELIYAIMLICLGWWVCYNFWYSPKAQIKRILKQMYKLPIKFSRMKRKYDQPEIKINSACIEQLKSRNKFINALLDYYFEPEEEKEYIQEKRREAEFLLHTGEEIMLENSK